eukprot:3362080-Prymnesium_polylepis.1
MDDALDRRALHPCDQPQLLGHGRAPILVEQASRIDRVGIEAKIESTHAAGDEVVNESILPLLICPGVEAAELRGKRGLACEQHSVGGRKPTVEACRIS